MELPFHDPCSIDRHRQIAPETFCCFGSRGVGCTWAAEIGDDVPMSQHQWSWQLLRAGAFRLDGGSMFGIIPKGIWSRWTEPDDQNRIPLQTNCLLLGDGSRRVLIETGCGSKGSPKDRSIYAMEARTILDALGEIGVDPASISSVIHSHVHFDHAGGLTHLDSAGDPQRSFPNAEVIVQRTEWEDALANKSTMKKTYLRSHLDPVADCVRLVDGSTEVLPGITVQPLLGHTWGMQGIAFDDTSGTVAFPADLMPTAAHVHPAASMGYDMLPHETMLTKEAFLDRSTAGNCRIVLGHEPGGAIVRTVLAEGRRALVVEQQP